MLIKHSLRTLEKLLKHGVVPSSSSTGHELDRSLNGEDALQTSFHAEFSDQEFDPMSASPSSSLSSPDSPPVCSPLSDDVHAGPASLAAVLSVEQFDESALRFLPTLRSGQITPLNPERLAMSMEQDSSAYSRRLAETLLKVAEEQFSLCKDPTEASASETRGFQGPMLSIAGIAKRGWNLSDSSEHRKSQRHQTALSTAGLPPEDVALLEKWTSVALQDIIKEQNRFYEHGLHRSKRDVAPGLDPLQLDLLTEARAKTLFDACVGGYWIDWRRLKEYSTDIGS
jgi:hypothetical protein